jgi:hypothetical protein
VCAVSASVCLLTQSSPAPVGNEALSASPSADATRPARRSSSELEGQASEFGLSGFVVWGQVQGRLMLVLVMVMVLEGGGWAPPCPRCDALELGAGSGARGVFGVAAAVVAVVEKKEKNYLRRGALSRSDSASTHAACVG